MNFSSPDPLVFPQFTRAKAIEVILEPGDTLYIPPYWWHRVEALDLSMSLSVVSPSAEEGHLSRAYWMPLPFRKVANSTAERAVAVQVYLVHLISRLPSVSSPREFATELYETRFAPIYPESSLSSILSDSAGVSGQDLCLARKPKTHAKIRKKLPKRQMIHIADQVAKVLNYDEFESTKVRSGCTRKDGCVPAGGSAL